MKPEDEISIPLNYSSIKVLLQCTLSLDIRLTPWHFCTFNENLRQIFIFCHVVCPDTSVPTTGIRRKKNGSSDDGTKQQVGTASLELHV